jgi:hypothetical protein
LSTKGIVEEKREGAKKQGTRPTASKQNDETPEAAMEIDLNREIVSAIIDKAREFNEESDVMPLEDQEELAIGDGDFSEAMVARHGEDPGYQRLKGAIEDLDPDQQMTLVALMWLGRGDYTAAEWDEALKFAEENWTTHTADYLIGTPLLADYLAEALEQAEDDE